MKTFAPFFRSLKFIDIHTHNPKGEGQILEVWNVSQPFDAISQQAYCSVGMHPWHLKKETLEPAFATLTQKATHANIIAIGECGLDRVCKTPFSLQEEAFQKQIDLANTLRKPLIIHCVRAYDEVYRHLQESRSTVPVLIHGFNKKVAVATNLVKKGYFLSFGSYLFRKQSIEAFKICPLNQLFLETDDDVRISIIELYEYAAHLKGISVEQLKEHICNNFKTLFPFIKYNE